MELKINNGISFYINKSSDQLTSGFSDLTGVNVFDGQPGVIQSRWDQQSIRSPNSYTLNLKFMKPFDNKCTFVQVSGSFMIILPGPDSQILFYPVGIISPKDVTKNGFNISALNFAGAEYVFNISYYATGY